VLGELPPDELLLLRAARDDRGKRTESERFKPFGYEELMQRDKISQDLIWLRDGSLEDSDNLPPPDVLGQEIVEDLEAALGESAQIAQSLGQPLFEG
jgi:type I restriction enzyme M protein